MFSIPNVPKKNSFHFLRLLCCLIVIYEHSVGLSASHLLNLRLRSTAVAVFFILSGFWVTISLLRSVSIKEYAVKRCKKILPPYFSVVLFAAIGLSVFSSLPVKEYFSNTEFWKYIAANFSTLNFLHPSLPGVFEGLPLGGAVNGALWTIKVELAFYVCLPFVFLVLNKYPQRAKFIMIGLYLLSVSYSVACHFLVANKPVLASLENQFPAFVTYFVCGITFILNWERLLKILNYAVIPSAIILVLCLWLDNWILSLLVLPIVLTITVFWFAVKLPVLGRVVTKDFSFGMYLVHYPFVMLFIQQEFFESCWGLAFAAVLGLSFLCSYLLEKAMKQVFTK